MTAESNRSVHDSWCLARSVSRSSTVTALCLLLFLLSFRSTARHEGIFDAASLIIGHGLALLLTLSLFLEMKCVRERAMLLLAFFLTAFRVVIRLFPSTSALLQIPVHRGAHIVWLLCTVLALSLMYSSLQNLRKEEPIQQ